MNDKETLIARLRGQCNHDEAHALLEEAADMLESLAQPAQEQEPVAIEYWLQDTMESGRWVTTGNMSRATAEDYCEVYPQGRIVEPSPPQPEQEPVAWMNDQDVGFKKSEFGATPTVPLYTTPPQPKQEPVQYKCTVVDNQHPSGIPLEQWAKPQRKPWVNLTDEEIQAIAKQARSKDHAVTLTNKFLKEKNT